MSICISRVPGRKRPALCHIKDDMAIVPLAYFLTDKAAREAVLAFANHEQIAYESDVMSEEKP